MQSPPADEWLTVLLQREGGMLLEHGLFKTLLNQLSPHSADQFPSVVSLFGSSCNPTLVNTIQGGQPHKSGPGIFLKLDVNTVHSESPVFYANCLLNPGLLPEEDRFRSDCRRYPLTWYGNNVPADEVVDRVYSNLIVPFSDVVCFFSNSLPNAMDDAEKYLRWVVLAQSLPQIQPQPRAIFIFTDMVNNWCHDFRHRADRIRYTLGPEVTTSIAMTCLPEPTVCRRRAIIAQALDRFRTLLFQQANLARADRDRFSMRFNSEHFGALFGLACQHFSAAGSRPFNYIQASRMTRPVPRAIKTHIMHFLQAAIGHQDLITFIAPVIASALMMNSCPPGMHRFSGHAIFHSLYRTHVIAAYHESTQDNDKYILLPDLLHSIERHLDEYVRQLRTRYLVPSSLHLENLAGFKARWTGLSCDISCFACLLRMPEHVLHAGHAICSQCVGILGTPDTDDHPYRRSIIHCPLCQIRLVPGPRHVTLQPPTAGHRILTMDGGGVRGILELELLQMLEEKVQFPIRHGFDLMVGTSTGGLIALGLGVNGWSVERCAEQFETLLGQAFRRRAASNVPVLGPLIEFALAYLTDSFYDSSKFALALVSAFGSDKLFGKGIDQGMKVAVIATNTNSFPCILSNYNGPNERSINRGYANLHGNVMVHEAYHTAITLSSIRISSGQPGQNITLQDGGVGGMNNPGALALRESQSLNPSFTKPDLLVSVGTNELEKPPPEEHRGWFQRIRLACRRCLDCQKTWNEQFSQLKENDHDSFHRLALEFAYEPPFNDTSAVGQLKRSVRTCFRGAIELVDTAAAVDAKCFFFELGSLPAPHGTHHKCSGVIFSRLQAGSPELRSQVTRLASHCAQFSLGSHRLAMIDATVVSNIDRGARFALSVEFLVLNLQESIAICVTGENQRAIAISSFPQTIAWFVDRQEIGEAFGRSDHAQAGSRKRKARFSGRPMLKKTRLQA